jgi:hypothetical protein
MMDDFYLSFIWDWLSTWVLREDVYNVFLNNIFLHDLYFMFFIWLFLFDK